jgi:transcriptional regulator with XRE-family HTH domain
MPVIHWNGVEDTDVAARVVGLRLKHLRETRGLTLRELAERVDASKNTILRIEKGMPIAEPIVHRICDSLQTILPNLLVSEEEWSRPLRVHRNADSKWRIAFRREKSPSIYKDFEVVESESERTRMGSLGFVSGFLNTQNCSLRGGKLESAVIELYGHQEKPGYRHSGEELVHCLSGCLRLTVGLEVHELLPGDTSIFFSEVRHRYECGLPKGSSETTRFLMVWMEGPENPEALKYDEECAKFGHEKTPPVELNGD